METHSSILAWEISWIEEPGGLWSIGSDKELDMTEVPQHACSTSTHTHTHTPKVAILTTVKCKVQQQ